MANRISDERWHALRGSLKDAGDRFAELIAGAPDPGAASTKKWSIAQTAAHVTVVAWLDGGILLPDIEQPPIPGLTDILPKTNVDGIHALNELALDNFPERDPKVLAEQLREHIAHILDQTAGIDWTETVTWVGGSCLPKAGVMAHLLNEILQHGYDIAKMTGVPWTIAPEDAALFIDLFFVELGYNGVGQLLAGGDRPRARRIAVEFRSRYTNPVTIVLHNGVVTAEPPGPGPDVKISFDPVVLSLVLFGRVGKAKAALTRGMVVSGRRPWLLPLFLKTVRAPTA